MNISFKSTKTVGTASMQHPKMSNTSVKFRRLSVRILMLLSITMAVSACKLNRTQKGAGIGTVAGGAMGAVIGKASGNTALGAIIGAAVGGTAGAVIGNQMDKQAKEIEESVPGVIVERVGEGIVVEFTNKILFGFDQSELSSAAKSNLSNLVKVLNDYPDTNIEIQGHTDSDGSTKYNKDLSERRAIAVSNDLITKGIDVKRIVIVGYGEQTLKYQEITEEDKAKNRRVEFLITANDKMISDAKAAAGN